MRDFMDLFSLKGKKAIVTGGTRGLGYGMAEGLCRAGAEVAILGTSEKVRESADALARTTGVVVHGIVGDLVREEEVPNIYKRLVESLDGQADILVNCAGVQHRCVAEDFPMEEWNRILRVNLGAMFQMSQLAARDMDDYHTSYSDGSGQQFITLVSKSGNTFYLVIDRNDKGENTVHFMNLVDEADLLSLMEDEDADAYTAEKEAAAQAEQERKQAEEDAKKAAEEAAASGSEQTGGNKVTKYAATFLGVLALAGLVAGGGIYTFMKQKQKKQAEKEALDPDADYTEDKGDFEIPVEDDSDEDAAEDTPDE